MLQLLPQAAAIEITEAELTNFISNDNCVKWEEETTAVEVISIAKLRDAFLISNDNCVKWEEETTAVEVNTIAKLRDAFLMSKGFNGSSPEEFLCICKVCRNCKLTL